VSLEFLEKVVNELKKRWQPGEVMIVDEIGKMELFSELFREWIREAALDANMPFLATIALKSRDPVVIHLKKALPCWEVTHLNRNKLATKVLEYLQSP
jgi:nucleoside-triphosphatase